MSFIKDLQEIKERYKRGENIIDYIKSQENQLENSTEAITISYDLQAGSYTQGDQANPEIKQQYTEALAKVIKPLGDFHSILEAGVGEATTLANLPPPPPRAFWDLIYPGQESSTRKLTASAKAWRLPYL